jgi:phosphomannomutase|tara:strand:+ start:361 stop:1050 length:690 start_codon:yes stop_codon:yes gene_type:complete
MKYIFDVDGTLTPSRKKIDPDFLIFFNSFALANEVYLVTGSDRDKTIEQITHLLYCNCKRVYNCAGNDVYEGDVSVYRNDWTLPLEAREHLNEELLQSTFPVRTGIHIEERPGCVNFSIVGRGANQTERLVYSDWDEIKGERRAIAERFNKKFPELHAFVGGVTGVDISDKGSDKSQIIRDFQDGGVVFYGDRMEEQGNDKPLADAILNNKLGEVVSVTGWKDTWNKLR